ncbi:hypothetical protein GCM10023322_56180 [Rugosimonospora acidiphila]|uniref:CBM2 domain-containing protein n=2 Tax=Rugosimonospora acidiphila TaxID=556531 RepID=A0ABP9SB13_9ACTN
MAAVAALAVAAAVLIGIGNANAESNGGTRVMPLGDSITDGLTVPGGYRIGLWQRFQTGGYRVDFVGSLANGPASLGDHDHEGHSGWRIDQLDANIVSWLNAYTPHTILLHIGTNDIAQNYNLSSAPARLSTLIDHITATAPSAEVFVATIIPLGSASLETNVRTFNAAIPGIVQGKVSAGKHVHLVDMHSALTTADLADGVHPNAGGYEKMAATWFSALTSVPGSIGSAGGPSPSPTSTTASPTTPPTSAPPTSAPPTGCTASLTAGTVWGDRYNTAVNVTGSSNWIVTVTITAPQKISSTWNISASWDSSGNVMTARPNGNGNSFGFTTMFNGNTGARPRVSCRVG